MPKPGDWEWEKGFRNSGRFRAQTGPRHLVTSFFICQKIPSSSRWGKETLNYVVRALIPPMTVRNEIIQDLLGKQKLYTEASLNFWKPKKILELHSVTSHLKQTGQCCHQPLEIKIKITIEIKIKIKIQELWHGRHSRRGGVWNGKSGSILCSHTFLPGRFWWQRLRNCDNLLVPAVTGLSQEHIPVPAAQAEELWIIQSEEKALHEGTSSQDFPRRMVKAPAVSTSVPAGPGWGCAWIAPFGNWAPLAPPVLWHPPDSTPDSPRGKNVE